MPDPTGPGACLLATIEVTCAGCGRSLMPATNGHERFFTCGCWDGVMEAADLDAAVIETVTAHMQARLACRAFDSSRVRDAWRYATAVQRQAMVITHLAGVTVSRRAGQVGLSCLWHTNRPQPSVPAAPGGGRG